MSHAVRTAARNGLNSSSVGKTSEWLVLLADKPGIVSTVFRYKYLCGIGADEVQLERRVRIRPVHSKNFVKLHESGFVSWAGTLCQDPAPSPFSLPSRP